MKRLLPITIAAVALLLNSCGLSGSLGAIKDKMPGMPSMPKVAMPKMPEMKRGDIARFSFRDLLPSRVPVVEVREKDLKELKLGKDRALAYEKQGGFFRSWFGKPVDFKEPDLPVGALDNPEFGLLPPKSE